MAVYYVRKNGNNGSSGLSPAQAWLTVDNAANNVAAGDRVWIGPGVYREMPVMDVSGAFGSEIEFFGDPTGRETGDDAGLVVITAHDADDGAAIRAYSMRMDFRTFVIWRDVVFVGGTTAAAGYNNVVATTDSAYEGCEFERCVLWAGNSFLDYAFSLDLNDGLTPATVGLLFKQCVFVAACRVDYDAQAIGAYDLKMVAENCLFTGFHGGANDGFWLNRLALGPFAVGGVDVINNTFLGRDSAVLFEAFSNVAQPCTARNNLMIGCTTGVAGTGAGAGAVLEDFNVMSGVGNQTTGVVTSGGSTDITVAAPLLGGLADISLYALLGWSPWKPWEPIIPNPAIRFASAAFAPDDDLYGNPRPMGRNTDDAGAVENHPIEQQETAIVQAGDGSLRLEGASYREFWHPVEAGTSITVSVYGQFDANYTGATPILELTHIPGVADQSDAMIGGAGAWEQLSITMTPTDDGWIRVHLRSRDTSANGLAYFDTYEVA